jgi:hypothetical protein
MTKILRMPAIGKSAQPPVDDRRRSAPAMRPGPAKSLFRRINSLLQQQRFPVSMAQGMCPQAIESSRVPAAGTVETARNFANSLLFSLLPGNAGPAQAPADRLRDRTPLCVRSLHPGRRGPAGASVLALREPQEPRSMRAALTGRIQTAWSRCLGT